jgi:hypothetical protein
MQSKYGLLLIDEKFSEIILLARVEERSDMYSICDFIKAKQILSISRKKASTHRILLEVRVGPRKYAESFGV